MVDGLRWRCCLHLSVLYLMRGLSKDRPVLGKRHTLVVECAYDAHFKRNMLAGVVTITIKSIASILRCKYHHNGQELQGS